MNVEAAGNFYWWANWGLAGGILFVVGCVAIACLREWWKVTKPHVVRKQELEIAKEQKQCDLYDALRETEPQKLELMKQQLKLTEAVHATQRDHHSRCHRTDENVERIVKHLGID